MKSLFKNKNKSTDENIKETNFYIKLTVVLMAAKVFYEVLRDLIY